MSPTTDNFIHSLVEMSKAFEELPTVKEQLESQQKANETLSAAVSTREESILKLKAELEASHEAKRKVEAERDDAEMRFLELDEKAHKALAALGNIMANVNDATRDLTPPTPPQPEEPKHEPATETGYVADAQSQQGQSEQHPTSDHTAPIGTGTENAASSSSPEVPKSDANPPTPTASSMDGDGHSPVSAPQTGATSATDVSGQGTQTSTQPYAGKRYYDHPTYLTRDAWHAGGGTDADYDWRPGRSVGF